MSEHADALLEFISRTCAFLPLHGQNPAPIMLPEEQCVRVGCKQSVRLSNWAPPLPAHDQRSDAP